MWCKLIECEEGYCGHDDAGRTERNGRHYYPSDLKSPLLVMAVALLYSCGYVTD